MVADLTGQTFGKRTVLHRDQRRDGGQAYRITECKCGAVKSVCGYVLRAGFALGRRSCAGFDNPNPNKPKYKPGEKVGKWTIEVFSKATKTYLCRCQCGVEQEKQAGNLTLTLKRNGKNACCRACFQRSRKNTPTKKGAKK